MRPAIALLAAAGLCSAVLANEPPESTQSGGQPGSQPASQPAGQPADAAKAAGDAQKAAEEAAKAAQAAADAGPKGIPVPDGPVVERRELAVEGGAPIIIEELTIGDGYEVPAGGAVVAHYHGTLKDGGKVFDSSFQRGQPAAFPLGGVIQGWQKGVPGMKIGGVRRLTIPSALAYGSAGAGQDIPPNADLIFTIQLVDAIQIQDVTIGSGEEVGQQFVAVTAHVLKDADGKELEKSDAAKPYIWIPREFMAIDAGLVGMKVGGKRVIKVPKDFNQPSMIPGTTRPAGIAVTLEVELIALRNLMMGGPGGGGAGGRGRR